MTTSSSPAPGIAMAPRKPVIPSSPKDLVGLGVRTKKPMKISRSIKWVIGALRFVLIAMWIVLTTVSVTLVLVNHQEHVKTLFAAGISCLLVGLYAIRFYKRIERRHHE